MGFAEKGGAAVVCNRCGGTGKTQIKIEWEDFTGREGRDDVKWVYKVNPGIGVGDGGGYKFSDFGGVSYEDWLSSDVFPEKTENRLSTCPAWWYQAADYERKPDWNECVACGTFSQCDKFNDKRKCWEKWDKEYAEE